MSKLLLTAVLVVALGACAPAPAAAPDFPILLERWQRDTNATGVSMAVAQPGREPWLGVAGLADRDTGAPLVPTDLFQAGSITKTFVATVVLQLAEEGALDLDDPLGRFVPDFPDAEQVTIRQLLSHTSGIPDYTQAHGLEQALFRDRERRWTTGEILALVADRDRSFPPGTSWAYSNTNYLLLGQVIEAATGSSWAAQVHRRIIDPLGLRHTSVGGFDDAADVVAGYYDADNDGDTENVFATPWPALDTIEGPAGAIVANASDLARFARALFDGVLLSPASLAAMTTPVAAHSRYGGYGLGLAIEQPDHETSTWGHGGAEPGFRADLRYLPADGTVIVVLVNEWQANPADLAELTIRLVEKGVIP